jgi:glutamine amidotransferase
VIAVIDYGMGNVKSVANMLRKIGYDSEITNDPLALERAEKVILPGVGAFDAGIEQLKNTGFNSALNELVLGDKVPILGICLGMQLFATSSEEGVTEGLGWLDADVIKFNFSQSARPLKVPHMGWNEVELKGNHPLFKDVTKPMRFYFVHSFHYLCHDKDIALATSTHGYEFVCCVAQNNILGVQFHPEKSHKYGMQLLKNFAEIY